MDLSKLRNIGISAHIDSGKTTLSERVLYYCGRIHRMQEVKGGGAGATMDHMELERERGITITSAATSVEWDGYNINLIDTPGHVDFTVEVERSLRVLDGAILVLCAVGGVQAQSLTIDRQMRRYRVPRLAFINKMDRTGSNPQKVVEQLRGKLGCDAVLMQLPIGAEHNFEGVVDLLREEALYFDGDNGEDIRREPVPADMVVEVKAARQHLLELVSMYSDEMMELLLAEENLPFALVDGVIRAAVLSQQLTPVFIGSAYKNKGVQPLLDAVVRYLPSPLESPIKALAHDDPHKDVLLTPDPVKPLVGMGFKIVEDSYGTLTFMRVYQGTINKGESYFNQRTGRKERFSRIVRMHADQREDIDSAESGDIVAVLGLDAASGDTYCSKYPYCTLESMFVPEPVIKVAVAPANRDGADRLSKALHRFRREDPTLHISTDEETAETIMAGMGELHLEIYIEPSAASMAWRSRWALPRSTIARRRPRPANSIRNIRSRPADRANTPHRRHHGTAARRLTGHVRLRRECRGRALPKNFIPAVEKGFRQMVHKGPVAGYPVVGLKVTLEDGSYHDVDSSDMAFQICARTCMRENFPATRPVLLEPVMKIEIECPTDFQGPVVGNLTSRRGMVVSTEASGPICRIEGEVPLSETFGYSTDLRSMTQGQGTFTMEFAKYRRLPASIEREVIAARKQAALAEV